MNQTLRFAVVLTTVCLLAAVGVSGVYTLTEPRIRERQEAEKEQARREVASAEVVRFEPIAPEEDLYRAVDASGKKTLGYVATGKARGYSGDVAVTAGFTPELKVVRVVVTAQTETPGLGAELGKAQTNQTIWGILHLTPEEVKETSWLDQFKGKNGEELTLAPGKIDARTGATITSRAITVAVRQAFDQVKKSIEEKAK